MNPRRLPAASLVSATSALLLAGSAEAAVQSVSGLHVVLDADTNGALWALTMGTDGVLAAHTFTQTAALMPYIVGGTPLVCVGVQSRSHGSGVMMMGGGAGVAAYATGTVDAYPAVRRLASGVTVSGGGVASFGQWGIAAYSTGWATKTVGWTGDGYVGFWLSSDGGTTTYTGWVSITVNDTDQAVINGYGWEDVANTAIAAGGSGSGSGSGPADGGSQGTGTPEPTAGGLGLLALGAAGILRRRR